MLARFVEAALKHDRDAERAATRGAAPYPQKSKSKVAALDALLIRAEADDDEDAAALKRVFQLITDASAKAARKGDDRAARPAARRRTPGKARARSPRSTRY